MRPGLNGGLLKTGNPGNSGRKPTRFYQRAEELCNDDTVWDVQLARAKSGDIAPLKMAAEYVYGRPAGTGQILGAQVETPEGYKFSLILGERDQPGD